MALPMPSFIVEPKLCTVLLIQWSVLDLYSCEALPLMAVLDSYLCMALQMASFRAILVQGSSDGQL
jgi:hypothetical protein